MLKFKKITICFLALVMFCSISLTASAAPYGTPFKFYVIEPLPVHDVMPSLLIIIDTPATRMGVLDGSTGSAGIQGKENIMQRVDEFCQLMLATGEETVIDDIWYYTQLPNDGFTGFEQPIQDLEKAVIDLIVAKYPNEKTRPRWRQVLLYVNNTIVEGNGYAMWSGYNRNMRITGINHSLTGIHGSLHAHAGTAEVAYGANSTTMKNFYATYGSAHVAGTTWGGSSLKHLARQLLT